NRTAPNPRPSFCGGIAADWHNVFALTALRRSGESRAVDLGSNGTFTADERGAATAYPARFAISCLSRMDGTKLSATPSGRCTIAAGMRQSDEPKFFERSIRHHVQCAGLSRMVFAARSAAGLRISPALSPTFAGARKWAPLDPKSAYPHVCATDVACDLSRRAFLANAPLSTRSHHFCLQSDHDFATRL